MSTHHASYSPLIAPTSVSSVFEGTQATIRVGRQPGLRVRKAGVTPINATFLAAVLILAGLASGISMPAHAQASDAGMTTGDSTLLSISAQAEASRAPDIASLSTGVVTQAADANSAMRANSEQMARVMEAIKSAGISGKDIQTSGISLNPQYRYADDTPPAITGYQAINTVNIKVRQLDKLGKVLDALVASGANQINGPSFEIDKPEAVYDEARRNAIGSAQRRAEMYADTLGLKVRRIVSISEGGGFQPPRPMMMAKAGHADAVAASAPVSPGETSLGVNLDIVFELGH